MTEIDQSTIAKPPEDDAVFDLDDIAVFLDLDGALAPLADTPAEVGPDARRNRLLGRLAARLVACVDEVLAWIEQALAGARPLVGGGVR